MVGKSLKGNNQGSSILVVLITTMFVGLLASIILWMSFTNYKMKATDLKNKNNFYSAESVLDQIRIGLQQEVSDAFDLAYKKTMQNYNKEKQEIRENNFKFEFITNVRKPLRKGTEDRKYDIAKVTSYVSADLADRSVITSSKNENMVTYDDGVVLQGIHVEYTDAQGFLSIIDTDIRLSIPPIKFIETNSMPEVFQYCIVANNKLVGNNTGANTKFVGSIYGGKEGIEILGTSNWDVKNAARMVTNEGVKLEGGEAKLEIDNKSTLWANDILVNQGQLNLKGKTYIADDLTVDGKGSKVVLENEYYGYGGSKGTAKDSSAIVINGTNTTVDMSKLDNLLLAGHAFIASSKVSDQGKTNTDIMMGESVAIKSNQVAYLVPEECIGVKQGNVLYGKNPLSKAEYDKLQGDMGKDASIQEVSLSKVMNRVGRSLESYGASYKKVFSATSGTSLIYYYIVLDEANANRYFRDYYNADTNSKVNQYLPYYVDALQSNSDFTRLNLAGNMLVYEGDHSEVIADTVDKDAPIKTGLETEATNFKDIFKGLKCKLVNSAAELQPGEDYLSSPDKGIFNNLIKVNDLRSYLSFEPGKQKTLETTGEGEVLKAFLIDNKGGNPYYYGAGEDNNIRLILATGDVKIAKNFTGLVLSGGTITIGEASNVKIENNEEQLSRVLQVEAENIDGNSVMLINKFFTNGENYVLNGSGINTGDVTDTNIKVSDLVNYENWNKQ